MATRRDARDWISSLQFGVLSLVILPILPNAEMGPYGALNPHQIWWMVVLIAGVSLAGYAALQLVGVRYGAAFVGVFGGLASSTAPTMLYARQARAFPAMTAMAALVIVMANLVMVLRVAVIATLVAPAVAGTLALVIAPALVLGALAAFWHWRQLLERGDVVLPTTSNPTELKTAIGFGAAYAVQPAYGIGFAKDVYLWIPVVGNIVAVLVIPYVGNLSDKIGRKPPIIVGALLSGLLAFAYLYAISIKSVPLAFCISILMWGVVYQGYNAVYPSFYPELFPTRVRVSAMAISQNLGTAATAMLPALFTAVAPPGSSNIWLTVGAIAFGITIVAALACWSARETYRIRMHDLGQPGARPVDPAEYQRLREQALAGSGQPGH